MHNETASDICDKLQAVISHSSNPDGLFQHPESKQWHHMAFTGGEPMMKHNQPAMVAIMEEFRSRNNRPKFITVETNGTTPVLPILSDWFNNDQWWEAHHGSEWFWSVSPKLWHTSGEKPKKAIVPNAVAEYASQSNHGHLKYVVNGTQESWDEVEDATRQFREVGVDWDVFIMPVGATMEEQQEPQVVEIVMEAMKRGYHVAPRVHCFLFGNQVGT